MFSHPKSLENRHGDRTLVEAVARHGARPAAFVVFEDDDDARDDNEQMLPLELWGYEASPFVKPSVLWP